MAGYTSPDNLPYPNDYNEPADVPAATEALAAATQVALDGRLTTEDGEGFVAKTGDTMTGLLSVKRTGAAELQTDLTNPTGYDTSGLRILTDGQSKWLVAHQSDELVISRYDVDTGVWIDVPLRIYSDTGAVVVNQDPTSDLGVATKRYADGRVVNASSGSETDLAMSVNASKAYAGSLSRSGTINLGTINSDSEKGYTLSKASDERCFITVNHPSTWLIGTANDVSSTSVEIEVRNSTNNTNHTDVKVNWLLVKT